MTRHDTAALPVPPWALALVAITSVQLASALSVGFIDEVGAAGAAWLRLSFGALMFLAIARPPLRTVRRADLPALVGLGIATGVMTICFLAAIARIPLGTAVAIEFLGPLTVAGLRRRSAGGLIWPALALVGVVALTEPWRGSIAAGGIAFAACAAVGWGSYIVLTQRVGDRFTGLGPLSITVAIGAATAARVGIPQARGHLTVGVLLTAIGLALLLPVIPFALEMLALRQMTPTAFGTLMAIEPAMGTLLGLVVLKQTPGLLPALGVACVVLAGAGAQRGGRRAPRPSTEPGA
jgi:inner membrane transporter RhtA